MPQRHWTRLAVRAQLPPDDGGVAAVGVHGYPRPMLRRAAWQSLNGPWEFAIDPDGAWRAPSEVTFSQTIQVPYSPETRRSGIADNGLFRACWYRRRFNIPQLGEHDRLLLHFGAVDDEAVVWVN